MKKLLAVVLTMLLGLGLFAPAMAETSPGLYISGDWQYTLLADGTAEITGYTGQERALRIPDQIDGRTVSSIGRKAFEGNNAFSAVYIPPCVGHIGAYAFNGCHALISVSIGEHIAFVDQEKTISEAELLKLLAIGMGAPDQNFGADATLQDGLYSPYQPIKRIRTPIEESRTLRGKTSITRTFPCRVDDFLSQGYRFLSISESELEAMRAWEQKTGKTLLFPMLKDNKQTDANLWYPVDKRGRSSESCTPDLVLEPQYRTDAQGEPVCFTKSASGVKVRVLNAIYYEYLYGFAPVYPTMAEPVFTPSTAAPAPGGLVIEKSVFFSNSLVAISVPDHVQRISYQSDFVLSYYGCRRIVSYGSEAYGWLQDSYATTRNTAPETITPDAEYISGDFTYVIQSDGTAKILYYTDREAADLVIPDALDGHQVTAISPMALRDCKMTTVSIPAGVTDFGGDHLSGHSTLESIHVAAENPVLTDIDGVLIDKTTDTLLYCPELHAVGKEYVVPSSIRAIGGGAFRWSNSSGVVLPADLERIGPAAFIWHHGLTRIDIPDSVQEIGVNAFNYCPVLEQVRLPRNLKAIAPYTFQSCYMLCTVAFPAKLESIGEHAFKNTALQTISLPESLRTIGAYAFQNTDLTELELPDGLIAIDECAFWYCRQLDSVILPASLETVGEGAFSSCEQLYTVTFLSGGSSASSGIANFFSGLFGSTQNNPAGSTQTTILDQAFADCPMLNTVTLSENIIAIADNAFALNSINPNNAELIDKRRSLMQFTAPAGSYAEQWCRENNLNFTSAAED